MARRAIVMMVAVVLLAPSLVVVSALADLRSPDGTAELGATLADDPTVQAVLVAAVVDAILEDAVVRSPIVVPLAPLLRPLLTRAAEVTIASPAGRAAVASALTDALRQLTLRGPVVIDLRAATLAAAEESPPPLDALARAAIAQGSVGLVVLGDDHGRDQADLVAAADTAGRVAGLPGGVALALVALLLAGALGTLLAGESGRRTRLLGAGTVLAIAGATSALLVRVTPGIVVDRLADVPAGGGSPLTDVLPVLVDGLAGLLTRTGAIGVVLAGAGLVLLGAGALSGAGSPPTADRPAPG